LDAIFTFFHQVFLIGCYFYFLSPGLSDWMDEDDIMAQVIAQSHNEYINSLKKSAAPTPSPNPDS
jgi:hypothetical protein